MSEVPFYRTQMGRRFYEHTLPELARQVSRLADGLERLAGFPCNGPDAAERRETTPSRSAPTSGR